MIFGKTTEAIEEAKQVEIKACIQGRKEFAWFPVKLKSGRYIWLEHYYAYYHGGHKSDGKLFLWSISPDTYCPIFDAYTNKNDLYIRSRDVKLKSKFDQALPEPDSEPQI